MNFKHLFGLTCGFGLMAATSAFALPKSAELVESMGLGYNIGNTMEAPGDPTIWGNAFPTETYVKAIKDAGFNSVRIPCAWDTHAKDGVINAGWLDSVKTVVDLVTKNGMYAVLNSHWDHGWLEDHVWDGDGYDTKNNKTTNSADAVAELQGKYWTQIANKFKDYDEKLIFASANEPGVNDPRASGTEYGDNGQWTFDEARMKVLRKYHEACIKAVRATGGNNATRTIVVQMPRTEIDKYELLSKEFPTDEAGEGYLMAEAHYYPYQYSLMTEDADWGKCFYYFDGMESTTDTPHNMGSAATTLGTKAYTDAQFSKLETAFGNKGIPVIIGEFGAVKRLEDIVGENLKLHLNGRAAWYGSVAAAAKTHKIVTFAWDTGDEGNNNMTIIRRQAKYGTDEGTIVDIETLNALRKAYGLAKLEGKSIIDSLVTASLDTTNKMLEITYTTKTSDSSEVGTMRIDIGGKDWSAYKAISFQAKVDVKSAGPATKGDNPYAWTSLSLFAMSSSDWKWTDYNFEKDDIDSAAWKTYTVPLGADGLELNDQKAVQAIGLNLYGSQVTGTIQIDNVLLIKADGTYDVLQDMNKKAPATESIASGKLVTSTAPAIKVDVPSSSTTTAGGKALKVTYTTVTSDSSEVGTIRFDLGGKNWSNYTSVVFQAKVDVNAAGPATNGDNPYAWTALSAFAMSGSDWEWADYNFDAADIDSAKWKTYTVPLSATGLNIGNKASVQAFGINLYGTQVTGTITFDNILLVKADGSADTLASFDAKIGAKVESIAKGELVESDAPAMTGIKATGTNAIKPARIAASKMFVNVQQGYVNATFSAANAGMGSAKLINGLGQVIAAQSFTAHAGNNTVQLKAAYRGPAMLMVKQGSQSYIQKVILK